MRKFKSIFYPHWLGMPPIKDVPSNIKSSSPFASAKKNKDNLIELKDFDEVEISSARKKGPAANELLL